jgi:hypothetical protein
MEASCPRTCDMYCISRALVCNALPSEVLTRDSYRKISVDDSASLASTTAELSLNRLQMVAKVALRCKCVTYLASFEYY